MQSLYFLDTETTSSDPQEARVVEIAIYNPDDNTAIEERCYPSATMRIGAIATHHITMKMLEGKPHFSESKSKKFLQENPHSILVAHNAPYDVQVLVNDGVNISQYIDTLKVAKHILDDEEIESYSLQYLRYFYDLDKYAFEGELPATMAHSAMYDTVVLRWLFEFLKEKIFKKFPGENPIIKMLELTHSPVILQKINFGKYRGKKFSEIAEHDFSYLLWLKNNSTDADVLATCKHYTE